MGWWWGFLTTRTANGVLIVQTGARLGLQDTEQSEVRRERASTRTKGWSDYQDATAGGRSRANEMIGNR